MLYFTELEKMNFLSKRGYTFKEEKLSNIEHLHGSKFIERETIVWIVQKDGKELSLDIAFNKELKSKLLNE